MKVADLKSAFATGRPLVEQSLDIAEQMAALRTWCREREVDWQQVKSLLKAQMQDEAEGKGETKRVNAILAKADNATAYAAEIGFGSPEKKISRVAPQNPESAITAPQPPVHAPSAVPSSSTEKLRQDLQASIALADAGPCPDFLLRNGVSA